MEHYDLTNFTTEELTFISRLFNLLKCVDRKCIVCRHKYSCTARAYIHTCSPFSEIVRDSLEELRNRKKGI